VRELFVVVISVCLDKWIGITTTKRPVEKQASHGGGEV